MKGAKFSIANSETVAIIGRSGAGKSTVVNLLLRLWDMASGTVRVGGTDIRDLPVHELRDLLAIKEESRGRTTLIIVHRGSTILNA